LFVYFGIFCKDVSKFLKIDDKRASDADAASKVESVEDALGREAKRER
jgi:hypothetical protein